MALYTTDNPLADALAAITGCMPPQYVSGVHLSIQLLPGDQISLQGWCSLNALPAWATGESIVDAADLMVARAVENGNIEPPDDVFEMHGDSDLARAVNAWQQVSA